MPGLWKGVSDTEGMPKLCPHHCSIGKRPSQDALEAPASCAGVTGAQSAEGQLVVETDKLESWSSGKVNKVAVPSSSEPCVTARVEYEKKPGVTVSSELCVTARVECERKPGAPVSSEPCVTARVSGRSKEEEELVKATTQGEEENQPDANPIKKKKRVSWLPFSSEDDSSAKSESKNEEDKHNEMVLELPKDEGKHQDTEDEEKDHALLPLIQEAVDMILTKTEVPSEDNQSPQPIGGGALGSSGGNEDLSMGENTSQETSVKLREWVGVEDEVEAAALDNRNFIRVMVGNESYLALLDPGATISLVGSRILNKYRGRLRESSGQVRGVSGVPMKVQGKLRISIDVDGHLGTLEFRAVEEINHDIILGMDFGVE